MTDQISLSAIAFQLRAASNGETFELFRYLPAHSAPFLTPTFTTSACEKLATRHTSGFGLGLWNLFSASVDCLRLSSFRIN